jgi:zinc D-Ala-D-Ala carboxypeptidase
MQLSKNFSLEEMTKSQTALRKGIDNVPNQEQIDNMVKLAENILQPIRDEYGSFLVSSGYRSPELCLQIGSSIDSQHAKGQAADFEVAGVDNMELAEWIRDNLEFDQLILECYTGGNTGWIHCSYVHEPRKEILTYNRKDGYVHGLVK